MYIEGKQVENETNTDIENGIRQHAKDKNFRIMGIWIIRHCMFHDTVSCKILIPESQQWIALSPSTWPDHVSCRPWSNEPPRRKRGYYGYLGNTNKILDGDD